MILISCKISKHLLILSPIMFWVLNKSLGVIRTILVFREFAS